MGNAGSDETGCQKRSETPRAVRNKESLEPYILKTQHPEGGAQAGSNDFLIPLAFVDPGYERQPPDMLPLCTLQCIL